jgi:uncharacterized phage protein gp47/JayE
MADNLYVPQVDYTSRDYASLRDDLIGLISNFAPQWTSRDSSDFGIVLIELFSYLGDVLNYQIDRAANESFIDTATQRDTVLRLASLLGYTPTSANPATGTVSITNKNTGSSVTIPKGTVVSAPSTNSQIDFTTDSEITISASSTASVAITQGNVYSTNQLIGLSDGTKSQVFALPDTGVLVDASLSVTVGALVYTKVSFLVDYGNTDPVYSTYTDADGITYVQFGDGISGLIPPNGQTISAVYRYTETQPSLGNVGAGTITQIDTTGLAVGATVSVINTTATSGGTDEESTDSIRVNAPNALRALSRAVSADDYASLAIGVDGVAKAKAIATSFASVALYLAAAGGSVPSSTIKNNVITYFTGKTPPGTSLALYNFSPAYPYLNAIVAVLPQYNAANVQSAVLAALETLFSFDNVTFNDYISEGDIYSAIKAVDGVSYITINDYEKLPTNVNQTSGFYSQTGTVNATVTGTSVVITAGTCGIMPNSIITSVTTGGVVSTTHAAVGKTISSVTSLGTASNNTIVLSASTTLTAADIITVKGNAGTTAGSRDLTCGISEIPIYNADYFTITTTGGAS